MAIQELRDEESDLERLASLVVDAMEIGTGKADHHVGEDLCRTFGVDLRKIEKSFSGAFRKSKLRAALSAEIARGAGSAAELMTEVVRCGGRFLAMIEEIYSFLAAQRKTTTGTSEEFRFRKDGIQLDLPISPAFIEQVRILQRALQQVETGTIDDEKLGHFIGMDGGELYGSWPPGEPRSENSMNLARSITQLAWISQLIERHRGNGRRLANNEVALRRAIDAGEKFIQRAETLIRAHARWLRSEGFEEWLQEAEASLGSRDKVSIVEKPMDFHHRRRLEDLRQERDLLDREGILGSLVNGHYFVKIPESSIVGVRVDDLAGAPGSPGSQPGPVVILDNSSSDSNYHHGTSLSHLACVVAIWRLGLVRTEERGELRELLYDLDGAAPEAVHDWLSRFEPACRAAVEWLDNEVWTATGIVMREEMLERLEEYLNLPLWRHRDLLYEIWLLCATMTAIEIGGWEAELFSLEAENDVWTLAVDPTDEPVGRVVLPAAETVEAMVWREPRRRLGHRQWTPDISIATPGQDPRDLIVVEAKDRYKMSARGASKKSASEVGKKYLGGLHPAVTWVCNHCDFREEDIDPRINRGDSWRHLYFGSALRPGNIPATFASSICSGLRPLELLEVPVRLSSSCLVIVLDTTGSMHSHLEEVWERLGDRLAAAALNKRFHQFRGLLFSDHGPEEPYLLREVDAFPKVQSLVEAMREEPLGHGGDEPEALEDAIRHCRILAENLGPVGVLVATDAPPHPLEECPESVDFHQEMVRLLETGSSCFVVDDWQSSGSIWQPYEDQSRFHRSSLRELLPTLIED